MWVDLANLTEARVATRAWRNEYNHYRPRRAHDGNPPAAYAIHGTNNTNQNGKLYWWLRQSAV